MAACHYRVHATSPVDNVQPQQPCVHQHDIHCMPAGNKKLCYPSDGPRDALSRAVSQNLVYCRNKLYSKTTTNRSNAITGLQTTDL